MLKARWTERMKDKTTTVTLWPRVNYLYTKHSSHQKFYNMYQSHHHMKHPCYEKVEINLHIAAEVLLLFTSCSMVTASQMILLILLGEGLCLSFLYSRQAKSQCSPSSLLISSFEKVSPDIRPLGKRYKVSNRSEFL